MEKELGKITSAYIGYGGYQDAQMGLHLQFGGKGWGIGNSKAMWGGERSSGAKWSEEDRIKAWGEIMAYADELLLAAKVRDVSKLVGIPVEVITEGGSFKSFRILTEVL